MKPVLGSSVPHIPGSRDLTLQSLRENKQLTKGSVIRIRVRRRVVIGLDFGERVVQGLGVVFSVGGVEVLAKLLFALRGYLVGFFSS